MSPKQMIAGRRVSFQVTQKRVVETIVEGNGVDHAISAAMKAIGEDLRENDQGGEYEFSVPFEMMTGNPTDNNREITFRVNVEVEGA